MVKVGPSSAASIPNAWTHPRVEWQSAPVEKLEIREVPSASDAIMANLWEMDLSPGRESTPERRLAGRMVCCMKLHCKRGRWKTAIPCPLCPVPMQGGIHRSRHLFHV